MPENITPYESALRIQVGWGIAEPEDGAKYDSPHRRGTLRPDGTADWHLLIVFEGRFILNPESDRIEMPPGSAALFPPHVRQDYLLDEYNEHGRFFWAHFFLESSLIDLLDWPRTQTEQGLLRWKTDDPLHARISDACTRCNEYYQSNYLRRRSLALVALQEILRLVDQVNPNRSVDSLDDRVAVVLDHISRNIRNPLTLEGLASVVGLSNSRFSHIFARNMQCSPMEYVERQRIEMAASLLTRTTLPIAKVAEKSGFSSSYYFSKRFHKIKGSSPTQWRKIGGKSP